MSRVGFEPPMGASDLAKTVHAIDRAAAEIDAGYERHK